MTTSDSLDGGLVGQMFGNFRAVALLGQGGMGEVYLAEHPQMGRKMAVKVLRGMFASEPEVVKRFFNEARAANAIQHPNIIEVADCGSTPEGRAYLIMEFLSGEELSRRLASFGRLPVGMALPIAFQTASALAAAHRSGIVHRDLKPENLFLVPDLLDPDVERVKVLDFGIAKLQAQTKAQTVNLDRRPHRDAHLHVSRTVFWDARGWAKFRHLFVRVHHLRNPQWAASICLGRGGRTSCDAPACEA